jgi:hypothetical protein
MCLWNEFFALVLSVESGKLGFIEWWWLGGIYSRNHYSSRWLGFLSTGAPDSPVRIGHCIVHCPVPATSADCWGSEQLTIEFACLCDAPDSPMVHRTVQYDLASLTISDLLTFQTAEAVDRWRSRPLLVGSPVSPVNFSQGALRFPESGQFVRRASLGTRQSGALQAGANLICPIFREVAQWYIFLIDVYELYAPMKRSTRQTS